MEILLNFGLQFPSDGTNPVEIPSVPGSTVTVKITPEEPDTPVKTQLTVKACVEETSERIIKQLCLLYILYRNRNNSVIYNMVK